MGVLFDAFSYRVNKTPDGFYYDRWHGHVFPEISMPEKLYLKSATIIQYTIKGRFMSR